MFLTHMIVILVSWNANVQAPTEGGTITMKYAPKSHSIKGHQPWNNLNKELGNVQPLPVAKHW